MPVTEFFPKDQSVKFLSIQQINHNIKHLIGSLDIRFPKPLERAFHRATNAQIEAGFKKVIVTLIVVVLLSCVTDYILGPEHPHLWAYRLPTLVLMALVYVLSYLSIVKGFQNFLLYGALSCYGIFAALCSANSSFEIGFVYSATIAPMALFVFLMTQRQFIVSATWLVFGIVSLGFYWAVMPSVSVVQCFAFSLMYALFSITGLMVIFTLEKFKRDQFLTNQHRDLSTITLQDFADTSERLCYLVALDPQLGIANRSSFDRSIRQEWRRATRRKYPLSVVFLRFDLLVSTEHMAKIAQIASGFAQRSGDLVARYDNNLLVLLLVDTDSQQCELLVKRLQDYVNKSCAKKSASGGEAPVFHAASMVPGPALFPKDLIDKALEAGDHEACASSPNPSQS